MSIDAMIEATIGREGGYSNSIADAGGATRWGVTERVARAGGYTGDMRRLPRALAVEIYREQYAVKPGFADVAEIYPDLAAKLFDIGVNMGPHFPALWLQEWLNALNDSGRIYADIREDGDIGPATLGALRSYKAHRGGQGEARLIEALRGDQTVRYKNLARARMANEAFVYGWIGRASA